MLGPPLLARDKKTISAVETYLPYSPDLAPPDYFLFPNMKKHQDERHYLSDEDLITAVEEVFRDQDEGFYTTRTPALLEKVCGPKRQTMLKSLSILANNRIMVGVRTFQPTLAHPLMKFL